LPVDRHGKTRLAPSSGAPSVGHGAPTTIAGSILLAEDNEVNREVALALLESLGCSVDVAADGLEALAALDRKGFDLILMDCQMPRMDGFEATARIRASESRSSRRPIPIVALTANAMAETGRDASARGCPTTSASRSAPRSS
jgi:CheY-like chemotaxis protein